MTTRVIIVRHGESTYNVERRVQGHCDNSILTEKGRSMAVQVGTALREIAFDAIYSSPLKRANETANLIAAQLSQPLTVQTIDQIKEINLPWWEELLFTDVEHKYPDEYRLWRDAPHQLKMTLADGQEFLPVPDLYDRARQFWQTILPQHPNQTLLIVAHSGINRALINGAIGLTPADYQRIDQSNCGITVLNFSGGLGDPVQIESLNLTAHLGTPLPKAKKQETMRFLLVRHGETQWNREGRFQGQIDVPLNENGKRQADQAGEFLKDVQIDAAVSSPMARPKETAERILQHHPDVALTTLVDLCEISHGTWEGKLEAEIRSEYPGLLEQWQTQPETVQMPEGENLGDVWRRAETAWAEIVAAAKPGTTTLVVAHDAINKALLCQIIGLGSASFWNFKQGNGAVSVIDYNSINAAGNVTGNPILRASNITVHLGGVLDKTAAGAL
ncbi:MAG: histidine phosphatase family protein [Synechococcales bacterium]|nr:histidine phosphatase family protein [Synechococcales bacterium]